MVKYCMSIKCEVFVPYETYGRRSSGPIIDLKQTVGPCAQVYQSSEWVPLSSDAASTESDSETEKTWVVSVAVMASTWAPLSSDAASSEAVMASEWVPLSSDAASTESVSEKEKTWMVSKAVMVLASEAVVQKGGSRTTNEGVR